MRAACVIAGCVLLGSCHKKAAVVTPAPPVTAQAPPTVKPPVRKVRRSAVVNHPVVQQPPLGEYVEPSQRQALLQEIDRNLRECSARLTAAGASASVQAKAMMAQAQDARDRNLLLTAQRLSARALALLQQ